MLPLVGSLYFFILLKGKGLGFSHIRPNSVKPCWSITEQPAGLILILIQYLRCKLTQTPPKVQFAKFGPQVFCFPACCVYYKHFSQRGATTEVYECEVTPPLRLHVSVCACVCRWEGAGTRVWAPPPQSHGAPMFQWKQVGTPALLQSHRQSTRAESAGQEAGPNQLHTSHRKKSGKNTSEPACRSPSSFCACFGSGCGEYRRGSTSPERRWSSRRHLAAADGCSVGTLRRDATCTNRIWNCFSPPLFVLGLISCKSRPFPLTFYFGRVE